MPTFDRHPDDEILKRFAVGRLTEVRGDEIEAHLVDCKACTQRLDEIERKNSDAFLHAMKAAQDNMLSGDFTPGSLLGGHFRLEKQIGRGGMGEAWKAWDETAQRYVVLKFVPKDIQNINEAMEAVLESFTRVHALQHQHICPLYVLEDDPQHGFFLVMKFIDGMPLDAYSRKNKLLSFDQVVQILRDVADALDYAHSRKVIHRDVKPANIMIGKADGVQLIDFGLADEIRASLTRTVEVSNARITGTRSYMAPEQWEGRKQDARTDQYALAVTAYELLAGHLPFIGTDAEILRNCVIHSSPTPIPGLPEHVNAALLKGLAKNRNDRFESCKAFVEALANSSTPTPTAKPKGVSWIKPAFVASILIFFLFGLFLIRQSLKPDAGVDHAADHAVVEQPTHEIADLAKEPPESLEPPEQSAMPLAYPTRTRRTEIPVVRVTVEIDTDAKGRLTVHRCSSSEPLPAFRGIPFNYRAFRTIEVFRGENGMARFTFGNGDITDTTNSQAILAGLKSVPFGWKYWRSGGSYDGTTESMRFDSHTNEPFGVSLGKPGGLPCRITFEVVDIDENPPYLNVILYKDYKKGVIHSRFHVVGFKEESGLLQLGAGIALSPTGQEFENVVENIALEKGETFTQEFQLPSPDGSAGASPAIGNIDMIEYRLWANRSELIKKPGFHLSLLDIDGRFKGNAGFRVFKGDKAPQVSSIAIGGPASDMATGAEIISVNGQRGSASELQAILDALNFGDSIEVHTALFSGQGVSTYQFHAE